MRLGGAILGEDGHKPTPEALLVQFSPLSLIQVDDGGINSIMAAIIAKRCRGASSGTCLSVWRSCVEPLAAVPQHARTDQGHRTSMRRVPGVYVLSMEPRSWELTGASFIWGAGQHRIRGCLLCAPI